jgi:hypothetical protein
MSFLEKAQIVFKAIFSFKSLDLLFHMSQVGRHLEIHIIVKMDVVVRLALHQLDAFIFHASVQIPEGLMEQVWEE